MESSIYAYARCTLRELLENGFSETIQLINLEETKGIFYSDPFGKVLAIAFTTTIVSWLLTVTTDNYSYMDRLWPILPIVYSWILTEPLSDELSDARMMLMSAMLTIWGVRLASYFYIKGVYNIRKYDDYRWVRIKRDMNPIVFQIFNFLFIACFQNGLLVLMILPVYYVKIYGIDHELNYIDFILSLFMLLFVLGEATADLQQWQFQQRKKAGEKLDFISSGLFRYCRHPNYFCDIMVFVVLYFFTIVKVSRPINWSIVGALLYVIIFQKSIQVTERISAKKYKRYKAYSAKTWKVIPKPVCNAHQD